MEHLERSSRRQPTPAFPLADFLGMTTEQTGVGRGVARLQTRPDHRNPHGAVHGAVLFAMVDTAMGAATMSILDQEHWCASIDVQLRFFKAVFDGDLEASATVLHAGKRVVHLDAQVRAGTGELVAFATGAFAVLPRPATV